ncbi:MAG: cytochrome P460 [endosymbiont of Galathealinum brachiosum]|uniref:Cytochrome P460 n=1 Tax=endosymbiont of Galathealinum brachiosum TaxID=2200906 RepID=A0A370DL33_9GAMM|nr:MAG: cytochrome P460 [endosymbiont of Galathealinum brachiosum]
MKLKTGILSLTLTIMSQSLIAGEIIKPSPNGITLPEAYKDWKVISISHRTDNHSMRTILGNDIAVKAARAGNTNPWPKGSILGKLVWKQTAEEHWPAAIAPDKFVHAEFMHKDSEKYKSTGGWGYARWTGLDQKPYGSDENFALECMGCHTPVKDNDWVFTTPAKMP